MSTLLLDVGGSTNYAEKISADLPVSYVINDEAEAEDCIFSGPADALETILWRYVTEMSAAERGEYVTAETASTDDREDFEHFNNIRD